MDAEMMLRKKIDAQSEHTADRNEGTKIAALVRNMQKR